MLSIIDAARKSAFFAHISVFGKPILIAKCGMPTFEACAIFNESDHDSHPDKREHNVRQKKFSVEILNETLIQCGSLDKNDYVIFEDHRFVISHAISLSNGRHVYALNIAECVDSDLEVGVAY